MQSEGCLDQSPRVLSARTVDALFSQRADFNTGPFLATAKLGFRIDCQLNFTLQ
jgi:hypothetical protein